MKLIHATGYDIHVADTAIAFRQPRTNAQPPDAGDTYWLSTLSDLTRIDQATYHRIKFGAHAARILQMCERELPAVARGPDSSIAVCDFAYAPIRLFDDTGTLRSTITLQDTAWAHASSYGIARSEECIWLALPTDDTVLALDNAGRIVHTLTAVFHYPESLTRINTTLYVCDMGHHRLCTINLRTLAITVVAQFVEPLWEYHKLADQRIIRLKSGIYQSTNLDDDIIAKPAG